MSEIKYINIEDDRLWEILFDEACVEGGQAERIQKELEKIAIDEKEITRKPMQEIVERLEEERNLLKHERNEAIEYDDEQIIYATNNQIRAFDYSIRVVKEVGGMNE